ncbi:MAG: aspartate/glutamate racemase family protein, partial [Sulfuricurvum sp.]|nr:aspartate/glutamate racemase family protein [Sulfuricurvum sp.]
QPCPGLVQQIEAGKVDSQETLSMLEGWLSEMRDANVDTIVLGCTHYPLVKKSIEQIMHRRIIFVDSAEGVTKRLLTLMEQKGHINSGSTTLEILATGTIQSSMVESLLGDKFSIGMIKLSD